MTSSIVALNGSPSHPSKARALAEVAIDVASGGELIDLASLDPGALLAVRQDDAVDHVRDLVAAADVVIAATPVYRATYTALLKSIFDLLPQGALRGTVVVPIAVGYGPHHALAIDHGLRPLAASLGGLTTPTGVYATAADFDEGTTPTASLRATVAVAVHEAIRLRSALAG